MAKKLNKNTYKKFSKKRINVPRWRSKIIRQNKEFDQSFDYNFYKEERPNEVFFNRTPIVQENTTLQISLPSVKVGEEIS